MPYHEDAEIPIKKIVIGELNNNVYVVRCPATEESIVIDASGDAERIAAEAAGTTVRFILLTHGDADHWGGLIELKQQLGVPFGIHPADAARLPLPPDFDLRDGETIQVGTIGLRVLHTPGHTAGSVCFRSGRHLFSGDTFFPGGPGLTRREGGDFGQIIESIRTKLFVLPDETTVYPGHGADTTIGAERPQLDEWIQRGW